MKASELDKKFDDGVEDIKIWIAERLEKAG